MGKTAIILGASGLTGSIVLEKLIEDDRYDSIILFSRSKGKVTHSKITEHNVDLLNLSDSKEQFHGDEVYCCIGTTKKKTPDQKMYHQIDYGIPVSAAKLTKQNGIKKFMVISAMGANVKSSIFYNRTKGEMEEAVIDQGIENTYILQPALITGDRKEKRSGEKFAQGLFTFFDLLLLGPLKKYQSIKADRIAQAMINLANDGSNQRRIKSDQIKKLARS